MSIFKFRNNKPRYTKEQYDKWSKYFHDPALADNYLGWLENSECDFDPKLVELLHTLLQDKNKVIGISKTGEEFAQSACKDGFIFTGHSSQGTDGNDSLETNISVYDNLNSLISSIGLGYNYHLQCNFPGDKSGILVFDFPKEYYDEHMEFKPEYKNTILMDDQRRIKSQFILGYIEAFHKPDDRIDLKFIPKDKAIELYDQRQNDELER